MLRAAVLSLAFTGSLFAGNAARAESGTCLMLRSAIAAGDFLTSEAASEVPCLNENPRLALGYDRGARAPVATEPLPAGTYLGKMVLRPGVIAPAGAALDLVINDGPVTITRTVRAVLAARSGHKTFVKTGDGDILSARFVSAEAMQ